MGGSNLALKSITFQTPLQVMVLDDCARAKELFAQYSKERIIYGCSFYDDFWNTTDERSNVGLSFILSKTLYVENYEEVFGFGVDDFIIYLKLFCIFHLYEYTLQAFRDFLTSIRKMISVPMYQLDYSKPLRYSAMISDFIQSLPINNDTLFIVRYNYRKLQMRIGDCCISKLEKVAKHSLKTLRNGVAPEW